MTSLVWFRKDLRINDNPALVKACESQTVKAVYIDAFEQNREHQQAPIQRDFIEKNLQHLAVALAEKGIELEVIETDHFSDTPELLAEYCNQHSIEQVFANRESGVNEQHRDQQVEALLPIPLAIFHSQCIIPEGHLNTGKGEMFKVFTPFSRAWLKQLQLSGYNLFSAPKPVGEPIKVSIKAAQNTISLRPLHSGINSNTSDYWGAGEAAATKQLKQFCNQKLLDYDQDRDFPAIDGTSEISPYLAIGVLSANQCLAAIAQAIGHLPLSKGERGFCWMNELIWRDFYHHLMYAYPRLSMNRAFKPETESLKWNSDKQDFKRWCEGMTGFPIVDAAMRCLNQTGWMHNRLRMIIASFLCKDLHLDWRWGEGYFMSQLIDGELAANNGGWQWAAGTGADAAPYFRVFNPTTQGQRFDTDGSFVKQWLPELADVPIKQVHSPHDWLNQHHPEHNYPAPIVDHKLARIAAIEMFAALKSAPPE